MSNRRKFLSKTILSTIGISIGSILPISCKENSSTNKVVENSKTNLEFPIVLSTWSNQKANDKAIEVMKKGGSALDAVEQGVMIVEADEKDQSVGIGGRPDRDGNVTLDACIMNSKGDCGSVSFLQNIKHPIQVARKVMEDTPHVMLVGQGAQKFAIENGFEKQNLLTEASRKDWEEWKKESKYKPIINIENHDTIGMLAIDKNGDISGACTTSGLAFKMQGRVGDSPIIGAGLFIDNEIGGATATGMGEAVLKTLGSFLVVELMRQGMSPQEACEEAVMRIVRKQDYKSFQIGYIALNKKGEMGSYCIHSDFVYTISGAEESKIENSKYYVKS